MLRENVEHHVEEEEGELFDKTDDALTDEEIEALGRRMEAEKARQLGTPKRLAKTSMKQKGIISRIKEFVGLGSEPARKKSPATKQTGKKKLASKASKKAGKKAQAATTAKRAGNASRKSGSSRSRKSSTKRARAK